MLRGSTVVDPFAAAPRSRLKGLLTIFGLMTPIGHSSLPRSARVHFGWVEGDASFTQRRGRQRATPPGLHAERPLTCPTHSGAEPQAFFRLNNGVPGVLIVIWFLMSPPLGGAEFLATAVTRTAEDVLGEGTRT